MIFFKVLVYDLAGITFALAIKRSWVQSPAAYKPEVVAQASISST